MGGAGRKLREGCVETENEGLREGGTLSRWSLRLGLEEGHVYGVTFFFLPSCFFDLVKTFWQVPKTHLLPVDRLPR